MIAVDCAEPRFCAPQLTCDQKVTYALCVDAVFKAMADPARRELLDSLFRRDGQTLSALEEQLPMSRFGVMKHLRVLEAAGLVVSRRRGREKLHYLNPVPIRLVHDRWVSKYAQPWAMGLSELKADLEDATMDVVKTVSWADGTAPVSAEGTAVFEVFIKTTAERLWAAITDPEQRAKYSFGVATRSEWTPGSRYEAGVPGVVEVAAGENLVVEPPRLLVQTFQGLWSEEVRALGMTRVTWEIEPIGTSCRLTVTHDQLPPDANAELYGGWPMILSGLKTLLETGEQLDTPGSLRYA
ncbi:MAG TPA: SRPBCC domain-containing protein [Conexibacter sp.]|nr:SRPBCC domain-containing protein [Conexibacter sp.]